MWLALLEFDFTVHWLGPFCSPCVRVCSLWVLCLPSTIQRHAIGRVRLIGDYKWHTDLNCHVSLCVIPAIDWQPVHGVPRPCPMVAGIGSSAPSPNPI